MHTKHSHPDITHPALRSRMAAAMNTARHRLAVNKPSFYGSYNTWANVHQPRMTQLRNIARKVAEDMAMLEQQLDTAQDAAIVSDYCAAHPVGSWWPTGYPDIAASTATRPEPQGTGGQ